MNSTHDIERSEGENRVVVEFEEAADRSCIPSCAVPYKLFFSSVCAAAKQRLLDEKFNGLITRQYLREERMLDFTMHSLCALMEEEDARRDRIAVEERSQAARLHRYVGSLTVLAVAGTAGTLVEIEECEGRERMTLQHECLTCDWDQLMSQEVVARELAALKQRAREQYEAGQHADLYDQESIKRWSQICEVESDERLNIERVFLVEWRQLFQKLTWRCLNLEYDGRISVEREEDACFEILRDQATAEFKRLPSPPRVPLWPSRVAETTDEAKHIDAAPPASPMLTHEAVREADVTHQEEEDDLVSASATPTTKQANVAELEQQQPPVASPTKKSMKTASPAYQRCSNTAAADAWAALDAAWADAESLL